MLCYYRAQSGFQRCAVPWLGERPPVRFDNGAKSCKHLGKCSFIVTYEAGATIILILQMRKLKHREAKPRAQYHTATEPELYPGSVQSQRFLSVHPGQGTHIHT